MGIQEQISSYRKRDKVLSWEGTFRDYLQLVIEKPQVARNAHTRVYDMISRAGWEDTGEGRRYNFFSEELFGIDDTLQILVEEYLKPAALGLDMKKRVLLLMGPVGTGKSTIVNLIKKGLEEYSRTVEGALFGIKGCPMQEEPLHLVPRELRGELERLGIKVEGSLCPHCRIMVEEDYKGELMEVPVERVFISEENRVGIGTFVPSDPKTQDIAELTGSLDFSTIGEYGTDSHPRAYRFDGELNKANRGVMEFQEMLKCDERFLYNLLSLAQEGNFKTGRFALISADELVIGHTNRVEYEEFIRESRNEALKSRLFVIPVPYNLKLSQEERIYKKLLDRSSLKGIHLAPHALRTAAMFSVLTRLRDPKKFGVSLVKKMYLYDGQLSGGMTLPDVEEMRREFPGEGMEGVDPRFVLNCISGAVASPSEGCVTVTDILNSLEKGLERHPSLSETEREFLKNILFRAEQETRSLMRRAVTRACLECVPGAARDIFEDYMKNVSLYLEQSGKEERSPEPIDTRLMDRIEDHIQVTGSGKKLFREELFNRREKYAAMGRPFDFTAHSGLREAVEAEMICRVLDAVGKEGVSSKEKGWASALKKTLVRKHGFCQKCAREAVASTAESLEG